MTETASVNDTVRTAQLSAESIRRTMLDRAVRFGARVEKSLTSLGLEIKNDKDFFHRIKRGGNFTVETFDEVMRFIDARESELDAIEGVGGEQAG